MQKIILILFLGVIKCTFCYSQRVSKINELTPYLPKNELKFKLAKIPFILADTTTLSTNAVYVNISEEEIEENGKLKNIKLYSFMIFFKDGRVFSSFLYQSYPRCIELNDYTYGKWGRYVVEKNEIKIEMYIDRRDRVMFMFANPVENGINFYKSTGVGIGEFIKIRRWNKFDDSLYIKNKLSNCQ